MQQVMSQIREVLLSQKCVAVISHNNPDGDTLGSQLALAAALGNAGIETILLNNDTISEKYHFVAGSERIQPYQEGMELPEVVVFVDCASLELAGCSADTPFLQGRTLINIDHHTSNRQYGSINYVKGDAAANCQNMYELIRALDVEITPEIATALYMGLSTDTGHFLFDNVSSETLRIAAELKDRGADTNTLRLNMYESCSHKRIALMKYILNDLHISVNGKYAWSKLHYEMIEQLKPESTDIDGLVNTIKDIDGVEIAMLFRGVAPDKTKVSLRSKAWADVNAVAGQFGGGGHVRASGCSFSCSVEEAAEQLVPAVKKYIEETEQH
ncbi:MAG: bifunctional oligoribonuclease/PAP phosphatase NrnA [Peptococcaceae bacterium]|nr:bifunctional oligoribonuclease/PAP phosphatase NrnA [Peptococcaceae bacterium]